MGQLRFSLLRQGVLPSPQSVLPRLTLLQDFLPEEARRLQTSPDILSPGILNDILNAVMSNTAEVLGSDRLSAVLQVGDAISNVTEVRIEVSQ